MKETKKKMSKTRKGVPNPNSGKARIGIKSSKEHIDKVRKALAKTWILTDPSGNELTIINLTKFCRENSLSQSAMSDVAKGKWRHYKGWKCKKINNKEFNEN